VLEGPVDTNWDPELAQKVTAAAIRKRTWIAHLKNPFQNCAVPSAVSIDEADTMDTLRAMLEASV